MHEPEVAVPRVLALLWGLEEPGRRGPKPGLTLAMIGGAAVDLAQAHGLAAVSMKRVAEAVGVSTMALYRYVESKDELLTLMLEFATGPAPRINRRRSWRTGLEAWCRAYRGALLRHPWVLEIPLTAPPNTPYGLAWMEAALAAMDTMGLTPQERTQVLLQLNVYVRGDVALNAGLGSAGQEQPGGVSGAWVHQVLALTEADDFPAVHAMLRSGEFDEDDDPE